MASFSGLNYGGLRNGGRSLILSLLLASGTLLNYASASPLSEQTSDITITSSSNNETLDSTLLQTTWKFDCYPSTQTCRGTGKTAGGSSSKHSCASISSVGCTRYTFNGGGGFKLCLYEDTDCGGTLLTSVNGGSVSCIDVDSPESWKVVHVDTEC